MKIGLASDHWGYKKKEKLKKYLTKKGYQVVDYGTNSKETTDYPQYAFSLGEAVVKKEVDYGIVLCGTGIGVSIAANKVKGIRCAKINSIKEAKMAKKHNDANILAFGSKTLIFSIKDMIDTFFNTKTATNPRYANRNNQIKEYEVAK